VNSISLNDDIGTARCYDIASWDAIFLWIFWILMVQKYEKVCADIDFNCLKEHTPYGSRPSSGAFTSVAQESSVL